MDGGVGIKMTVEKSIANGREPGFVLSHLRRKERAEGVAPIEMEENQRHSRGNPVEIF
jgi:hypothetical protein